MSEQSQVNLTITLQIEVSNRIRTTKAFFFLPNLELAFQKLRQQDHKFEASLGSVTLLEINSKLKLVSNNLTLTRF